jgi:thioesterase domain-containing protein
MDSGTIKSTFMLESVRRLFMVALTNIRASLIYRDKRIDCSATLFRAGRGLPPEKREFSMFDKTIDLGQFFSVDDANNGWERVCTNLDTRVVPGDHYSLLTEPSLSIIVNYLCSKAAQRSLN